VLTAYCVVLDAVVTFDVAVVVLVVVDAIVAYAYFGVETVGAAEATDFVGVECVVEDGLDGALVTVVEDAPVTWPAFAFVFLAEFVDFDVVAFAVGVVE